MKNVLFFILISISSASFGQDSLFIKFKPATAALAAEDISHIKDFLKNKNAERITLTANFSSTGNVSRNRILADMRMYVISSFIANEGIPFNIIYSSLQLIEGEYDKGDVKIEGIFSGEKGSSVLKKSDKVQISLVDFSRPLKKPEVINKTAVTQEPITKEPEIKADGAEQEIVLDEAAFKKDATVSLPNLIFQGSSHYFLASSERILRALLKVMKSRPDIEIELQGHVCCNPPGVDAFDRITGKNNLSEMRAKAVYNYLVEGGIDKARMSYRGFGSSQRLYPDEKNATEQMLNRRVEVLITASD